MNSDNNNKDKDKNDHKHTLDENKEFKRMINDIERMIRKSLLDVARHQLKPGNSYVHGFNINIGPTGRAKVREFGNYPRKSCEEKISDEKKPILDVIEDKNNVSVTLDLPGVRKEDIDLNIVDDELEIKVDTPQRKFHKRISLPCGVKPRTTNATYKNGVLDVVLEKKNEVSYSEENDNHISIK